MKHRKLLKGNHALAEGALAAGCRYFFGYPITPQSELMEWMAARMPEEGGVFLQAESEVSAMNMVIGASVCGARVMTASSGPGMDLFQEGIGNMHAHQLPCVIADIMRGGPGNGALHPSQQDFNQAIKGRADQRNIVLAPWNAQEMYDLTKIAFELSDKYRNIAMILVDSVLGQAYESIEMDDEYKTQEVEKPWALSGAKGRQRNLSIAHFPDTSVYDDMHCSMQKKYRLISENEQRCDIYNINEDTDVVIVAYGIVARNAYAAVLKLKEEGLKVGLFRPITLFPFPAKKFKEVIGKNQKVLVVEMSAGQLFDDVLLNTRHENIYLKPGQAKAEVPKAHQIEEWVKELL